MIIVGCGFPNKEMNKYHAADPIKWQFLNVKMTLLVIKYMTSIKYSNNNNTKLPEIYTGNEKITI